MPYTQKIAEVQACIDAALAELAQTRALMAKRAVPKLEGGAALEKLLGTLARLKAEKTRLADRQMSFSK